MITSIRFQRAFLFCPTLSHSRRAKRAPTPFQKHSAVTRNLFLQLTGPKWWVSGVVMGKSLIVFTSRQQIWFLSHVSHHWKAFWLFWWLVFGWFPSANTIIDLNWTYVVHRDVVMFLTLPPLAPIIFSAKGSTISLTEPGLHAPNEDLQIKPRDFTPKGSEDPILLSSGIISVIQKEKKHQSAEVQLFFLCRRAPAPSSHK